MTEVKKGKDAPTNPRGIPYAPFVDKVEDYVSSRADVDSTMKSFQEMISKYNFMQLSTSRRISTLRDKIPDIHKTLDTVLFLKTRTASSPPLRTTFSLSPTLYAHAVIPPPSSPSPASPSQRSSPTKSSPSAQPSDDKERVGKSDKAQGQGSEKEKEQEQEVYLWLGANIMLSYPISDAEALLREKLEAARTALSGCEEDVEFLREQVTTLEVATARVYNWDVTQRRKEKGEGGNGRGDDEEESEVVGKKGLANG